MTAPRSDTPTTGSRLLPVLGGCAATRAELDAAMDDADHLLDLDGASTDDLAEALTQAQQLIRTLYAVVDDWLAPAIEDRIPDGADSATGLQGWVIRREMRRKRTVDPEALQRLVDEGTVRAVDANATVTEITTRRVDLRKFAKLQRQYGDLVGALVQESFGRPTYEAQAHDPETGEVL